MARPATKKIIPLIGSPRTGIGPTASSQWPVSRLRAKPVAQAPASASSGAPTMGTAHGGDETADAAAQAGRSGVGRTAGVEMKMVT
jgi:hypothetical protein